MPSIRTRINRSRLKRQSATQRPYRYFFSCCLFVPEPDDFIDDLTFVHAPKTAFETAIREMLETYREDLMRQSCFKQVTSSRYINLSRIGIINQLAEMLRSEAYLEMGKPAADKTLFELFCGLYGALKFDTPERGKRAWIRRRFRGNPRLPNYMQVILDDVIAGEIELHLGNGAQTRVDVFFDVLLALLENDYRKTTAGYVMNCIRDTLPAFRCVYREAVEVDAGPTVRSLQSHGRQIFYKRIPSDDIVELLQGFRRRASSNSAVVDVLNKVCGSDCYLGMAVLCFKYMKRAFDVNPSAGAVGEDVYEEQFEKAFSHYNRVTPEKMMEGRYQHTPTSSPVITPRRH